MSSSSANCSNRSKLSSVQINLGLNCQLSLTQIVLSPNWPWPKMTSVQIDLGPNLSPVHIDSGPKMTWVQIVLGPNFPRSKLSSVQIVLGPNCPRSKLSLFLINCQLSQFPSFNNVWKYWLTIVDWNFQSCLPIIFQTLWIYESLDKLQHHIVWKLLKMSFWILAFSTIFFS